MYFSFSNQLVIKPTALLFLAMLVVTQASYGRDVVTIDRLGTHALSQGAYFIEDPSGQMTVEDAMSSEAWQRNNRNSFVFGYTDSAYWVSVTLKVEHADRWYVVVGYPVLDYLDFYWVQDGKLIEHFKSGDRIPYAERPLKTREFVFLRDLKAGEEITFFLRTKTEGSYQIPIKLQSSQAFQESLSKTEFILGMFYGVLFIMTIYNLVLYLITNVSSYLYYVVYVMTTLFSRMAFDGSGFALLWPESPGVNEWILPIGFQLAGLAFWMFSYRFLDVKNTHVSIKVLFGVVFSIMTINLLLMPFMDYTLNVQTQSMLAAVALVIAFILSMFMTVTGSWYAAVFCIATMLSSLAFVIAVLGALGKFDNPDFSVYGYAYARVFEIILFAIALGVRIRHINNLRINAEQEAQESRDLSIKNLQQYQRLYENALTGNAVLSRRGEISSANRSFRRMLSTGPESTDLGGIERYFEDNEIKKLLAECSGRNPVVEAELQSRDGKWVSLLLNKVSMDDEHEFECTFVDISDRKESERIQEQAQQDKMESLQQLVVGIAHEINTPLGIVRTSSDFTRETLEKLSNASSKGVLTKDVFEEEIEAGEGALKLAGDNIIRLGEMISSFKKVSVQQMSYTSENLDVKQIVSSLTDLADEFHISINRTVSNECFGSFISFPLAVDWILSELVHNALAHSDKGNKLEIDCELILTEKELVIHFSDNGEGVEEHSIKQIFDPFFTFKRGAEKKLGLGLYQVYNLVTQLLKGDISAQTAKGLSITIVIPNLRFESKHESEVTLHA